MLDPMRVSSTAQGDGNNSISQIAPGHYRPHALIRSAQTNNRHGSAAPLNVLNSSAPSSRTTNKPTAFLPSSTVQSPRTIGSGVPGFTTAFEPPSKSGGAFRSIGTNGQADFMANPANGSFSVSLPIHTSSARDNFGPNLQLSYSSGAGNGIFGIGWHLKGSSSISRKTAKEIPRYDDQKDEFVFDGDLELSLKSNGSVDQVQRNGFLVTKYRPRIDSQMLITEKWVNLTDAADVHWRTISSDNVVSIYGHTSSSRIADGSRIFSWLITRTYDAVGNAMEFVYKSEDGVGRPTPLPVWEQNRSDFHQKYLKSILYGNKTPFRRSRDATSSDEAWPSNWMFEAVLDFGEHGGDIPVVEEVAPWKARHDIFSMANSGFDIRTYRICRRILMFHYFGDKKEGDLVSSTSFIYDESPHRSLLTSATTRGYMTRTTGEIETETAPATQFRYSSIPDLRQIKKYKAQTASLADIPGPKSTSEWLDLESEGIPGLLTRMADGTLVYQRNNADEGSLFSPPRLLGQQPVLGGTFADLDRNGQLNLVCTDALGRPSGFYERADSDTWSEYSEFPETPTSIDGSQMHIDLTGDGVADTMFQLGNSEDIVWQKSLGKLGVSLPQRVPQPLLGCHLNLQSNQDSQIMVADMTGDGLSDLVELRASKVMYWPNLGHGVFGPPVEMGQSPVLDADDIFDVQRVRLIDVDGSGPTDLVYLLPGGGANIYFNLAGNSWSRPILVSRLPRIVSPSSVFMLDILGQGTGCLCWADPNSNDINYIDLMGGAKPHVLREFSNELGVETIVDHVPSTHFFAKDRAQGTPWTTKLGFPVQCVKRVRTLDQITGCESITEYAYHNGCYDPTEKQFAGFEMVEQWSWERTPLGDGIYESPAVYTKSWFSVGQSLLPHSQHQFCTPPQIFSDAPDDTGAYLALRGSPLRTETYSLDGTSLEHLPYSVSEMSYTVSRLQKKVTNKTRYDVLQLLPRAFLTSEFDRRMEDPRVTHQVVLKTSPWGDVERSLEIVYPRRQEGVASVKSEYADIKKRQRMGHTSMNQSYFTNAVEDIPGCFRRPVLWRSQSFDVGGLSFPADGEVFGIEMLQQMDFGTSKKILLAEQRAIFLGSALKDPLDPGVIQAYSILDQTFTLAFTPDLIQAMQEGMKRCNVSSVDLSSTLKKCGYVEIKDSDALWARSGRASFLATDGSSQLESALQSFYCPTLFTDSFGNQSVLTLDEYHLMAVQARDAMGNCVYYTNDYHHLKPVMITDINGNRHAVLLDALGEAHASALLGKTDSKSEEVDSLVGLEAESTSRISLGNLREVLADPTGSTVKALLGNAGNRCLKFLDCQVADNLPACQVSITRDVPHRRSADPIIHVSVTYLDGAGTAIRKISLNDPEDGDRRWIVNGVSARGGSGQVVRTFSPVFAPNASFVPLSQFCSANVNAETAFADVVGRHIARLAPDHTWCKSKHSPWAVNEWHVGDTLSFSPADDPDVGHLFARIASSRFLPTWPEAAGRDTRAITQSMSYASSSPEIIHYDCDGLPIRQVNCVKTGITYTRSFTYDIAGNRSHDYDSLGRLVEKATYDKLGRAICMSGMDVGEQWVLPDVSGSSTMSWTSRGICFGYSYDALRRETERWILGTEPKLLVQMIYGELRPARSKVDELNMRGQVWQARDQSGVHTNLKFDMRGRCLATSYLPAKNYKGTIDWKMDKDDTGRVNSVALAAQGYGAQSKFDNFGQVIWEQDAQGNQTRRQFSRAGNATKVDFLHDDDDTWRPVLSGATFSADGLPLVIDHGNRIRVTYDYDSMSRRPLCRKSVLSTKTGTNVKEDMHFVHDCAGKLVYQKDLAAEPLFYAGCRVAAEWTWKYDGVGQLIESTGRAQLADGQNQLEPYSDRSGRVFHATMDKLYKYIESYKYDLAGNIKTMKHHPVGIPSLTGWARKYTYEEPSLLEGQKVFGNKLSHTVVRKAKETYTYDANSGCVASMPKFSLLQWNLDNKLCAVSSQRYDNGTPITTYYAYDHTGARVRKVTEQAASAGEEPRLQSETIFAGNVEVQRIYWGRDSNIDPAHERCMASVTTSEETLALVETEDDQDRPLVRFQLDSSEYDGQANLISHEEWSAFGTPVLSTIGRDIQARREYRLARYRWDRETGFYACGARFYCPWLARWTSPDPLGDIDGHNLYAYIGNDPVNGSDPSGTTPKSQRTSSLPALLPHVGGVAEPDFLKKSVQRAAPGFLQPLATKNVPSGYNKKKLQELGKQDEAQKKPIKVLGSIVNNKENANDFREALDLPKQIHAWNEEVRNEVDSQIRTIADKVLDIRGDLLVSLNRRFGKQDKIPLAGEAGRERSKGVFKLQRIETSAKEFSKGERRRMFSKPLLAMEMDKRIQLAHSTVGQVENFVDNLDDGPDKQAARKQVEDLQGEVNKAVDLYSTAVNQSGKAAVGASHLVTMYGATELHIDTGGNGTTGRSERKQRKYRIRNNARALSHR
ncbi:hypothetical protein JX265_008922 [Neoarthrinium moseri]|uniref:SpvB-domain-containing protein n=1 Tax=Neoarthrinium moseri TaxID=1658444 RepID=A0A9P9WH15_9PEZI|nr:hypothetical protein JX265_008922 [Neoarthrinium moseri]